jgi:hypothetical protein
MLRFPLGAALLALASLSFAAPALAADSVIASNQEVQGSQCVGLDCVNNESFGFDTLRLKENNTRIDFMDTSSPTGGFPSNSWALQANDTNAISAGGANRFMLRDVTGSTTPVSVFAGAPNDSLTVSSTGNLGLGTSTPALKLHLRTGNTPAIRLEQDSSGGFTPQTWDIGANEANFFVRDQTGGSHLPFRIRPGAPTSAIDISANGNVGFDTSSPAASLHIRRSDGTARLEVQEGSPTTTTRVLADLVNNGAPQLRFSNSAPGATSWLTGAEDASNFVIRPDGGTFTPLRVTPGGTVAAGSLVTDSADPAATQNPVAANDNAILQALRSLALSTWTYTADPANLQHLSPTATNFNAAFGLGANDGMIAPGDMAGVALVAIKALDARVTSLSAQPGVKGDTGSQGPAGPTGARGPAGPSGSLNAKALRRISALEKANARLSKQLRSLEQIVRKLVKH